MQGTDWLGNEQHALAPYQLLDCILPFLRRIPISASKPCLSCLEAQHGACAGGVLPDASKSKTMHPLEVLRHPHIRQTMLLFGVFLINAADILRKV